MTKKQKKSLLRILLSAVLLAAAAGVTHFADLPALGQICLYLIPYFVVGWDIVWEAVHSILHGQVFDEKFLMTLATLGAFFVGEYPEASFVMLFFQIGELFESIAVGKSRRSIASLLDIRPDRARVVQGSAEIETDPEEVEVGAVILVQPGERIPLDGVVLDGHAALDTAALTGESLPREVQVGDTVVSGCICTDGVLSIQVTKPYGESTVARILELVENAGIYKAKSEKFITRFAKYYTPCVVAAAVLLAVVPPLVTGNAGAWSVWADWIHRAMVFLVISCPCALVISVPLSFFGGVGGASAKGILIKGSQHLENLSRCKTFVFDKTGTLTRGVFTVCEVLPASGVEKSQVLRSAAAVESRSGHPLAKAVCKAAGQYPTAENIIEQAGFGLTGSVAGKQVCVGNAKLLQANNIAVPEAANGETTVYVGEDGKYIGCIVLRDEAKPEAKAAISALRGCGIKRICMLTGDRKQAAERIADELGIDEVYASLLPEDKVRIAQKIRTEAKKGELFAFVGDGINDAPVLAGADVGIAMGAFGSDAAVEAADVVLMNDDPADIAKAFRLSRRTRGIVTQNIVFALAIKFGVLILTAIGLADMGIGIFADVGVCVIAICNAMRTLR